MLQKCRNLIHQCPKVDASLGGDIRGRYYGKRYEHAFPEAVGAGLVAARDSIVQTVKKGRLENAGLPFGAEYGLSFSSEYAEQVEKEVDEVEIEA